MNPPRPRPHPLSLFVLALLLGLLPAWPPRAAAGSDDWRPVEPAQLAMRTPLVEPDADAEAIFWEVRVDDSSPTDLVFNNYIRIKIFTDRGRESQSKIDIVPFRLNARIRDVAGRTIRPDGSVVELKKEDVFEKTIVRTGGVKLVGKTFAMPAVEPGAIIEYRWREVYANALADYTRLYFQRDIPVERVKYYVRPATNVINAAGMRYYAFGMETPPFVKEKDGFYSATMTNMPAFRPEPQMPPEDEVRGWILIYYTADEKLAPAQFWKNLGQHVYDLYKSNMKPNDDVRARAVAVVGDAATPAQKLERLYDFCRTQIKNTDDDAAGLTDDDRAKLKENKAPADTLKRGQGTGLDINLLFAAMAQAAGFDPRIAMLADRSDIFFKANFADPYFLRYGYRVVAIKLGDRWAFYEPSQTYLPAGMIAWQAEWEQALITDPKEPIWVDTPLTPPARSVEQRTAKLKLTEDGTLEGDVRIEYTGHLGAGKKEYNDDDSTPQREQTLRTMVTGQMSTAELSNIHIENVQDPLKPFTYAYHVRVPGYAQRTGKRLFLQPAFFERGRAPLFTAETRKQMIYFNFPWAEQDEVEIELPAGFALDNADTPAPLSGGAVSDYNVHISVTNDQRVLIYKRSFFFGGNGGLLFPVNTYPMLRQLFQEVHRRDDHTITLKQTAAAAGN